LPVRQDNSKDEIKEGGGDNPMTTGENKPYIITMYDTDGNAHEVKVDSLPAKIQDKDGNVYDVQIQESDGECTISKSETSSSTTVITHLPAYIGYAYNVGEQKAYFCNSLNLKEKEEIVVALRSKIQAAWGGTAESCSISVKDSIAIDWYKAEIQDSIVKLTTARYTTETFYLKFNGQKTDITKDRKYIREEDLNGSSAVCELIVENTSPKTSKVIATFTLFPSTGATTEGYKIMEVERAIQNNSHRIDYYMGNYTIATNNDLPIKVNSTLKFSVKKVLINNDTIPASDDNTKWYVNDDEQFTGARFDYTVLEGVNTVKAILGNNVNDTIWIDVNPAAVERPDGRITPDFRALTARNDTVTARRYFNTTFSTINRRIVRNDLSDFINNAPKEIVVKVVNNPPIGGILQGGEASDGAVATSDRIYKALSLISITKDANNVIIDARLISRLNPEDKNNITSSVNSGNINQKTEVLLLRIARLSTQQRDSLNAMIVRKNVRDTFLDSLRYEITADDDIAEWMTFHNDPTIEVNVNLNDGLSGRISEDKFIELTAHELLHHWWTYFRKFEKLKWKVIKDKESVLGYSLADELGNNGIPSEGFSGCSQGAGHERYNPENKKVCTGQGNY
ncbi:MAG: hypothetical protein LBU84_04905, partial [Prevotella sp.]|nr:hypothetical protein [Prevotella sp.]